MKKCAEILLLGLFFLSGLNAHHVRLPLEEWESKNGKEFAERYGTTNAGRRMAGYTDGVFNSLDLNALSLYLSSDIPFYEQRNVIYVLAAEIKKENVHFSLEEEKEVVGVIIKKLQESEAQDNGEYRINLLKNGLKRMAGYYDPRLEKLSNEWALHENSYIREGAQEYLKFVSDNKGRSSRESVVRMNNTGRNLFLKKEERPMQVSEDNKMDWQLVLAFTIFFGSIGYLGYRKFRSREQRNEKS
jgi:hypothetical protein|tara:strand:+ start:388 stop:1119 length:732 start_codon:yes stop_codon:yes gene_type:complete